MFLKETRVGTDSMENCYLLKSPCQTIKQCSSNIWELLVKQNDVPFGHVAKYCLSNIF